MAATPYKVSLIVQNNKGERKIYPLAGSDVTTQFLTFPSGATASQVSQYPCILADMIFTAAGVDCSQLAVFINSVDTGIRLYGGTNLGTQFARQLASAPISVGAGAIVSFEQLT